MLTALLHRKLGRVTARRHHGAETPETAAPSGEGEEGPESSGSGEGITNLEDPLTSSIFERIAYLDPSTAWQLLRDACRTLHGSPLPQGTPAGDPVWRFWPKLGVGDDGRNARYVEPDVLVTWGEVVLLIEAKHRTAQDAVQWVEQIRAVRANVGLDGKQLCFVAVGGTNQGAISECAEGVLGVLGDRTPSLVALRWEGLREAVVQRRRHASTVSDRAILADLEDALEAWGYRRRFGFDSLPGIAALFSVRTVAGEMRGWRIR